MYQGDGKIIGHGSGIGPTVKSLRTYSKSRYTLGKGWICVLRVIPAVEEDEIYIAPAPPLPLKKLVRVTGNIVNVRKGPGIKYGLLSIAKRGRNFETNGLTKDGWVGIVYAGEPAWITTKYTEELK